MCVGLYVQKRPFLSDFNGIWVFSTDFLETSNFIKSVQWEPTCSMRTDMTKLIVAFRNFAKAPKTYKHFKIQMKHKPHIFANRQHFWKHYVTHSRCQPVFPISTFFYLNNINDISGKFWKCSILSSGKNWPWRPRGGVEVSSIPLSITNKMPRYTIFFITVNALHVPGVFSAHHQELTLYMQHLVYVKLACCYR
jgi:hypothetical protein